MPAKGEMQVPALGDLAPAILFPGSFSINRFT